ncbi:MAG: hypothetical protein V1663_03970 [archaeon]
MRDRELRRLLRDRKYRNLLGHRSGPNKFFILLIIAGLAYVYFTYVQSIYLIAIMIVLLFVMIR